MKNSFLGWGLTPVLTSIAAAIALTSCGENDALGFNGVDPALTVTPTHVMVLGTAHLSNYSDSLTMSDLDDLLGRLESYAPDVITVEQSSGQTCNRARTFPREHKGIAESYCFDGAPYREESGLSLPEASFQARNALLDWPETPTASQRRALAAAFIASEDPASAMVQWLRLDSAERVVGDGLGPKTVEMLNRRSQSINETNSIAARLAARRGLERVFPADDHGSELWVEGEREIYGARVSALWPGEGDPCLEHFKVFDDKLKEGDLIGGYRHMNSKESQRTQSNCDFKRTMNDDEPKAYGRQYTMGWEARNLRMVSLIMDAATTKPGGNVLSIVGASHKPYFEAYLDQMHDVEIVSTDTVLN